LFSGANIFISSEGTCKIGDFGFARKMTDWEQEKGALEGTYLYSAPEVTFTILYYY